MQGDPQARRRGDPGFGKAADSSDLFGLAVKEFGAVNLVVCNAVFPRQAMLFTMTEQNFRAVIRVHPRGHLCALRHATISQRDRAKAGIFAIATGAAQPMQMQGIAANVLTPRARRNEDGPLEAVVQKSADRFDTFAPENVSPLAAGAGVASRGQRDGPGLLVWNGNLMIPSRPELTARFRSPSAGPSGRSKSSSARKSSSSSR